MAGEAADLRGCVCIQLSCDARPKQIWRALRTRWIQTNLAGDRGFRFVLWRERRDVDDEGSELNCATDASQCETFS